MKVFGWGGGGGVDSVWEIGLCGLLHVRFKAGLPVHVHVPTCTVYVYFTHVHLGLINLFKKLLYSNYLHVLFAVGIPNAWGTIDKLVTQGLQP